MAGKKKYVDDRAEVEAYSKKREAELHIDRKKQALIKDDKKREEKESKLTSIYRSGVNTLLRRKDDTSFGKIKKSLGR